MPSQASQETLRDVYEISWLGEMEKAVRFSGWEAGTLGRCKFWCKENNEKKTETDRQKSRVRTVSAAAPKPEI
jgi:hypothetical protein